MAGHALRRLCEHFAPDGGKKITIVYGAAHMGPIMEYAQNDHKLELGLKTIPRAFYNMFGDESIRFYDYQPHVDQWVRSLEIK